MKIKNLTVCYEQLAILEDFSLELPDQGIICFFAPSGTGKTTLLRVLCGLMPAQSGTIEGLEEKKFAFVFQEDRLIPSLSVRDNVGLVLGKEYQALAQEYLGALGLSGWEESFPDELSGGMQRRAAIVRAFAYGKQHEGNVVYLLDEPLKGLDEKTAEQVMEFIRQKTKGSLTFFITHDKEQARILSDQILCFEGQPMKLKEILYRK